MMMMMIKEKMNDTSDEKQVQPHWRDCNFCTLSFVSSFFFFFFFVFFFFVVQKADRKIGALPVAFQRLEEDAAQLLDVVLLKCLATVPPKALGELLGAHRRP